MAFFTRLGQTPRKRHTQFRAPSGELYWERLTGQEGFSSDWSLLYHVNPPTEILSADAIAEPEQPLTPNLPLKPRHLQTPKLASGGDVVTGRQLLLGNEDVRIHHVSVDRPNELYRNAVGDELLFVRTGTGVLNTEYGRLALGPGDYAIIPTCTTYELVPDDAETVVGLLVEAVGHIRPPRRYLTDAGQFVNESPYCELDLRRPEETAPRTETDVPVLVRTRAGLTRYVYAHHPFDVVGWFGCHYPYVFNVADFEPITGSLHKPPTVHQVFESEKFVICNFVPRPLDYHPDAVVVPASHANVDSDEVLFFVDGKMAQREGSGISTGSLALHPTGFIHGPHPGTVEKSLGAKQTDETIIMVDTFRPLHLGQAALDCEDPSYADSWHAHV